MTEPSNQTPTSPSASPQDKPAGKPAAQSDATFLLAVTGLLVLIIVLLGVLWLKERRAHAEAERELKALRSDPITALLAGLAKQGARPRLESPEGAVQPLQDNELRPQTVTLEGRQRLAYRLDAAAGERIGLQPGDVVVVDEPPRPAIAPGSPAAASAPAGAPEGESAPGSSNDASPRIGL